MTEEHKPFSFVPSDVDENVNTMVKAALALTPHRAEQLRTFLYLMFCEMEFAWTEVCDAGDLWDYAGHVVEENSK